MQRVTGIGGVFLKSSDPKATAAWYEKHLGVKFDGKTYMTFTWVNEHHPTVPGSTVFSFFPKTQQIFRSINRAFHDQLSRKGSGNLVG